VVERLTIITLNLAIFLSFAWFAASLVYSARILMRSNSLVAMEGLQITLLSFFVFALFLALSSIRQKLTVLGRTAGS